MLSKNALLLLLVLLPFLTFGQIHNPKIEKVERSLAPLVLIEGDPLWTLEERMQHHKIPGLSIAVIDNYQVDWAKAYGFADAKEQIPLTVATSFQSASISKTVNAVALLKLVESGQLDLSKDINEYLRSWKFPYDEKSNGKIITLKHLLSHTAGLSTSGFGGYAKAKKLPSLTQILDGKKPANSNAVRSLFEPGKQFKYSGGGTVITQLILEDLLQKEYEDHIQANILKPLGMSNSFYTHGKNDGREKASGHWVSGKRLKGKYHYYPEQAPAGLWSTPFDLGRLIIELQKSLAGQSDRLLSQKMAQLMTTPMLNQSSSALGTFIEDKKGTLYFQHGGSNEGFKCQYIASMKGGKGVIIMTNSENFDIIPELVRSVASVYKWKDYHNTQPRTIVKVAADQLLPYQGTYEFQSGSKIKIESEADQLFLITVNEDKIQLFPESNHFFFMQVVDEQVEFIEKEGQWVLNLHQNGQVHPAKRVN